MGSIFYPPTLPPGISYSNLPKCEHLIKYNPTASSILRCKILPKWRGFCLRIGDDSHSKGTKHKMQCGLSGRPVFLQGASECDSTTTRCLTYSRGSDWAAQRRGQSGQRWVTRRQDSGSAALLSSVVWSHPDRNTLCTTSCCVNLCSIPYTALEEIVPHGTDTRHDTLEGGLVCVTKSNLDRMKGGQFFFSFNFLLFSQCWETEDCVKMSKGTTSWCFKRIFCSFCETQESDFGRR